MNLHQFRFVREAVRQQFNLTSAAKALFTSQPGVSKAIIELEDELGVEILELLPYVTQGQLGDIVFVELPEVGALIEQGKDARIGDRRVLAGPQRAGLGHRNQQAPRETGVGVPQRGRQQNRLIGQPPGLADGDDVETAGGHGALV